MSTQVSTQVPAQAAPKDSFILDWKTVEKEDRPNYPDLFMINPKSGNWIYKESSTAKALAKGSDAGSDDGSVTTTRTTTSAAIVAFGEAIQREFPEVTDDRLKIIVSQFMKPSKKEIENGAVVPDVVIPRTIKAAWGGSGASKSKTKKHPDQPTKGRSNYILYGMSIRKSLLAEGVKSTDIMAETARRWAKVEDKTEWNKLSSDDKERYERENKVFFTNHPEFATSAKPTKPTKPLAYNLFMAEKTKDGGDRTELRAEWKTYTAEDKAEFIDEAAGMMAQWKTDMEVYTEDMKAYTLANPDSDNESVSSKSSGKLSAKEQEKADQPEKYIYNTKTKRYNQRKGMSPAKLTELEQLLRASGVEVQTPIKSMDIQVGEIEDGGFSEDEDDTELMKGAE